MEFASAQRRTKGCVCITKTNLATAQQFITLVQLVFFMQLLQAIDLTELGSRGNTDTKCFGLVLGLAK